MFEELFAPGRKHTHDEQKRLELSREDIGDNDPGRGPIDLASGKVVVRKRNPDEAEETEEVGGEGGEKETGGAEKTDGAEQ
ncbi:DUF6191 domain-containing protein [Streptomyces sp. NPDC092369]|uniref:DUF6191 domain-containing protein n=1 Tax=Streptomyces sp. NPDC092369 TaxID=3366015 RepID=UPI00382D15C2